MPRVFRRFYFDPFLLVIGLSMAALIAAMAFGAFDGIQSLRSQHKYTACRLQQMGSYRYAFTDSVVCLPFPTRRDTLTLESIP